MADEKPPLVTADGWSLFIVLAIGGAWYGLNEYYDHIAQLNPGKNCIVMKSMYAGVTREATADLRSAEKLNDTVGIEKMQTAKKVFFIPAETKGLVLASGPFWLLRRVRILSGDTVFGEALWIESEFLNPITEVALQHSPEPVHLQVAADYWDRRAAGEAAQIAVKNAIMTSHPRATVGSAYDSDAVSLGEGQYRTFVPIFDFDSKGNSATAECLATKSANGWAAQVIQVK